MNRNKILIVMAAGSGVRMGATVPKQFLDLGGVPILRRTIEAFVSAVPDIKVVTVLPEDHIPFWKEYCLSSGFNCPQTLVSGGFTRFHSVRNALKKVPDGAIVAIHGGQSWWGDDTVEYAWYWSDCLWPWTAPQNEVQKNSALTTREGWVY